MPEPLPVSPAAAVIICVIVLTCILNVVVMFCAGARIIRACRASTATIMRMDATIWSVARERTIGAELRRTRLTATDTPPERKGRD